MYSDIEGIQYGNMFLTVDRSIFKKRLAEVSGWKREIREFLQKHTDLKTFLEADSTFVF